MRGLKGLKISNIRLWQEKEGMGVSLRALGRAIDDILPTTGKLLGGLISGAKR